MDAAFELLGLKELQLPSSWLEGTFLALLVLAAFVFTSRVMSRPAAGAFSAGSFVGFLVGGNVSIPVAIAVVGAGLAVRDALGPAVRRPVGRAALVEVGWVVAGLLAYELARLHTESTYAAARANAERIVTFERGMGLLFEEQLQSLLLRTDIVTQVFNFIYSYTFLPAVFGALVWLYVIDQPNYRLLRNCLGISAGLAIVTIVVFPVAPPRLLPELGIIDTVVAMGREHGFANEYAAVPSLHVGWIAVAGYAFGRSIGGRIGVALSLVPLGVMGTTVVLTGNHYWIDAVIGTAYTMIPAMAIANWESAAAAWSRAAGMAQRALYAVGRSRRALLTSTALMGLLIYLVAHQIVEPGFTDYWGYLVFQMAVTLLLLLAGEIIFADQGGLSWQTHVIAVSCGYLDTLGTDGNLYARIDEYDKLTHFAGVAAVTSGAYDCFRALNLRRGGTWPLRERFVSAIGVGLAVGLGWEIWEFIGDHVFNSSRIGGVWDTSNDLMADALGAVVAGLALRRSEAGAVPKLVADVSADGRPMSSFGQPAPSPVSTGHERAPDGAAAVAGSSARPSSDGLVFPRLEGRELRRHHPATDRGAAARDSAPDKHEAERV